MIDRLKRAATTLRELGEVVSLRRGDLTGPGRCEALSADGATPTVLAFHGYCGVPAEVELLVEAARACGLAAEAPVLAGHGATTRALAATRFEDWVASGEAALERASARGPVIFAGLSLGSLVALELCRRHPSAARGLILVSNALWLTAPFPAWALRAVEALRLPALGVPEFGFPKFTSDLGDAEALRSHTSYPAQPVQGAISLQRASRRLQGELGHITCPTLILHGARDRVCPVDNAWRAAERLGSEEIAVRIFPRSRHILTRDVERAAVRAELERFLRATRSA